MDSAIEIIVRHGYAVVFGWVFAEQIGLPILAEPVLLAGGAVAGKGHLNPAIVLAAAALASLASDTAWYWLGRVRGARVLGWLCRISLEPDSCVRRTERAFSKSGPRTLVIAKFVPGLNTAAPPLAGIVRMPLRTFLLYSGIGGLIWAGVFVGLGWAFSRQLELVASYAEQLGNWAVALGVIALAAYVAWKYISRQRFLRKIRIARISPEELKSKLDGGEDLLIVDVRDRLDFDAEPSIIPGALHLTIEDLDMRHHEIPRQREIVLYCT